MFPIKSRYGEDDGVGVACGNKEGGLYIQIWAFSLLKQPSDIDANDENINFKNMPTHALNYCIKQNMDQAYYQIKQGMN